MCDSYCKKVMGKLPIEQLELGLKETEEKNKWAAELIVANKVIAFQNEEKAERAAELIVANRELVFQNEEKDKRAAELLIANKELAFQNEEKDKRAAELLIANKELAFQSEEKDKRAAELIVANKELAFQNEEKDKRAAELIVANKELAFQNEEKDKRAAELFIAKKELAFQKEEKADRAAELFIANKELTFQTEEKADRAAELLIANKELTFQTREKEKRAAEFVLQRELAHIDRLNLIGNMAAGLAHEIRNPMTVVKGYLQFFKLKIPNNLHEQLDLVLSELARIETIITEFLEIAKTKSTNIKKQDLNGIIDSIAPFLLTEALRRAMILELKLTRDIPELMLAEKEIKQLMLNLAMNGLSAMERHGTLTIETKYQAGTVLLCIQDSGCGIAKDLQMKIFDPFFTTRDDGTGLGLSVCASIVAGHNAKIKVYSEEGEGACFIITFQVLS
jgi:signal transduction histidine kinase